MTTTQNASLTGVAAELYATIKTLPIVSPHGHTAPEWFAQNRPFSDPAELLIIPDHYVFRMLYSKGISLTDLGIGVPLEKRNPRAIFKLLATNWHLFLGTPSRGWLEDTFENVFGITEQLSAESSDRIYDQIDTALSQDHCLPQNLLTRFNIELIATTDGALDDLASHAKFLKAEHSSKVIPTFRPDSVLNPVVHNFANDVVALGALTGENIAVLSGYRAALRARRAYFIAHGATATDHDIPDMATEWLDDTVVQGLLDQALKGTINVADSIRFYNHMLIEMAQMSVDDGLVMQLHAGNRRSTNQAVLEQFGRDKGADIPHSADWVHGLNALLNRVGNNSSVTLIAFTLDESVYARELGPMAGHWPALKLGPPWWFHDSPNGVARYFDQVVENAGYYNLAGFNDDTRALMSIPARHSMWRRGVALHLSEQVAKGRFGVTDAEQLATWLARDAARAAYKLT